MYCLFSTLVWNLLAELHTLIMQSSTRNPEYGTLILSYVQNLTSFPVTMGESGRREELATKTVKSMFEPWVF